MYHFRKTRNKYVAYPKPSKCDFCDTTQMSERAVQETKYAYIVPNRTFYDVWEMQRVRDHLLVIPKKHIGSLSDLSDAAKIDIMNLIGKYEQTDYNVYARAVISKGRSVEHQHTHLIKTNHKVGRFFLFLRKPYFLIRF